MSLRALFQKPTDAALVAQARARVERWDRHRRRIILVNTAIVMLACWSTKRVVWMLAFPGPGQLPPGGLDFTIGLLCGSLTGGQLVGISAFATHVVAINRALRTFLQYHDALQPYPSAFATVQPLLVPPTTGVRFRPQPLTSDDYVTRLRRSVQKWERHRTGWLVFLGVLCAAPILMNLTRPLSLWHLRGLLLGTVISAAGASLIHRTVAEVIAPLAGGLHFERALIALYDACATAVIEPHNPVGLPPTNSPKDLRSLILRHRRATSRN